jgi:hypothetical protein
MNYQEIYQNATEAQRAKIDRLEETKSTRFDQHSQAEQELDRWEREERRTFRQYDLAEGALHGYMEQLQLEESR